MKWYTKKHLTFKLPKETKDDKPFELNKYIPQKKYNFVLDWWKDYEKILNNFSIIAMYAKKDTGKSWVGYLMLKACIEAKKGNIIYGRLQELEKKNAKVELFKVLELLGMNPYYNKEYGKDYICFPDTPYTIRLVNISSYQSIRGAIGEDVSLIWFDEINAYNFPPNFEGNFINIISTLGRKNNFKLLLTGNNETATNNPVLNALQLKFNWNYNGVQLATRSISGLNIIGIQLGYEAFNNHEISKAEKLARNNPAIYNTFYLGLSNTNSCNKIINLKEDYKVNKPLYLLATQDKIFLVAQAEVKDEENNYQAKEALIIKEEPYNYDRIIKEFKGVKMYALDTLADLNFKKAVYLDTPNLFSLIAPLNQQVKNENLFFCDFSSNEIFMNYFLPKYHRAFNPELKERKHTNATRK